MKINIGKILNGENYLNIESQVHGDSVALGTTYDELSHEHVGYYAMYDNEINIYTDLYGNVVEGDGIAYGEWLDLDKSELKEYSEKINEMMSEYKG